MKTKKYIFGIFILFLFIFFVLNRPSLIGVAKNSIEKDARKSQKIEAEWSSVEYINDDIAAFIFYPEDLSNHIFSIYVNRPGLSFGYFFRYGGGMAGISDGIAQINSEKGNILLSLNKLKVSRIEVDNGLQDIEEILIEDNKPFILVIPEGSEKISFYDSDGKLISNDDIVVDSL